MYALVLGVDPYFDNLDPGDKAPLITGSTREAGREVFMKVHLVSYEQELRTYAKEQMVAC